jgi:DNA-binding transcriptional MerR regulator
MLIGELARRSGVTTSALRYYEREGLASSFKCGGSTIEDCDRLLMQLGP